MFRNFNLIKYITKVAKSLKPNFKIDYSHQNLQLQTIKLNKDKNN